MKNPTPVMYKYAALFGFILMLCTLVLSSCNYAPLHLIAGNYWYSRGDYGRSTISYIKALESDIHKPLIYYNLGNVYHSLGETETALEALHPVVEEGQGKELLFRAYFNLGNIYMELGAYGEAVSHYIDALRSSPNEVDAKINLELALRKVQRSGIDEVKRPAVETSEEPLDDVYQKVLQLVKEKEEIVWESIHTTDSVEQRDDW